MRLGGIIDRLNDEGVLKICHLYGVFKDFRDYSKYQHHGVPSDGLQWQDDGWVMNGSGKLLVADDSSLPASEGNFFAYFEEGIQHQTDWPLGQYICDKFMVVGRNWRWYIDNTPRVYFGGSTTNVSYQNINVEGYKSLSLNFKHNNFPRLFCNGIFTIGLTGGPYEVVAGNSEIKIGTNYTMGYPLRNKLSAYLYTTRQLSDSEIAALHAQITDLLRNAKKVPVVSSRWEKGVKNSEKGLTAQWGKVVEGNKLIDLKGAYNGTLVGGVLIEDHPSLGKYLNFDGVTGYVSHGNVLNLTDTTKPITFLATIKIRSIAVHQMIVAKQVLLGNLPGYQFYIEAATGRAFLELLYGIGNSARIRTSNSIPVDKLFQIGFSYDGSKNTSGMKIYVNGSPVTTVNIENNLVAASLSNAINFQLGAKEGLNYPLIGNMYNAIFYMDCLKDENWFKSQANKLKKVIPESLSDIEVRETAYSDISSGFLENTPFEIQSGSFRISRENVNGSNEKVIKCVTDGVISVPVSVFGESPLDAAFGEWEVWAYKGADANHLEIGLIGGDLIARENSYLISLTPDEEVKLIRMTANYVPDGNMELPTIAWAAQYGTILSKYTVDKHSGLQSLKLDYGAPGPTQCYRSGFLPIGTEYRYLGWGRGDGTGGRPTLAMSSGVFNGTTSPLWQKMDVIITSTSNICYLGCGSWGVGKWSAWDDLSIVARLPQIASASAYFAIQTWNKINLKRNRNGSFDLGFNGNQIGVATDLTITQASHFVLEMDAGDMICLGGRHNFFKRFAA